MTKDVVISVRGLQVMDNESSEDIETVQQGEYFERNGSIFLLYDEYYEGFDEPVKNVMKIRGNEMTLTKRGIINVQMNFEAGKKEPDPLPDALRCNDDRAGHQPRRLSAGRKKPCDRN